MAKTTQGKLRAVPSGHLPRAHIQDHSQYSSNFHIFPHSFYISDNLPPFCGPVTPCPVVKSWLNIHLLQLQFTGNVPSSGHPTTTALACHLAPGVLVAIRHGQHQTTWNDFSKAWHLWTGRALATEIGLGLVCVSPLLYQDAQEWIHSFKRHLWVPNTSWHFPKHWAYSRNKTKPQLSGGLHSSGGERQQTKKIYNKTLLIKYILQVATSGLDRTGWGKLMEMAGREDSILHIYDG